MEMKQSRPIHWFKAVLFAVISVVAASGVFAEQPQPSVSCLGEAICGGLTAKASLRSRALANEVLEAVAALPNKEKQFFLDKRRKAQGFAIFPNVQKGGVLGASIYGRGILSVREDDGSWTAPVLLTLEGKSIGPQVGMQSSNVIFIFHTICSVKDFLSGHHHLNYTGTACNIVHVDHDGPGLEEPTDITVHLFERGLVVGQSVDKYSVHIDEEANAALYGVTVKPGCMLEAVRGGLSLPWMLRYVEKMSRRSDEAHTTFIARDLKPVTAPKSERPEGSGVKEAGSPIERPAIMKPSRPESGR
jgi:lipid-binding SYLF domain-containing protein